ncbi:hypothetical protein BB560_005591 [Smittium megazygosporum]|uniref:Sm domain-containing protein n=1 Tax=Smittium megazygosporum TaxID=133381 RepID=A0A2T9Z2S2_9FUNG|nr:hypothetical protein BB560_005591 [Smittium megazygosporum]
MSGVSMSSMITEPLDLVKLCLDEQAYDQHLNMVLEDAKETVTNFEDDRDQVNDGEIGEKTVQTHSYKLLFVRGDSVVLVSPPKRA